MKHIVVLLFLLLPASGVFAQDEVRLGHDVIPTTQIRPAKGGYDVFWYGRWQFIPKEAFQKSDDFQWWVRYYQSGKVFCLHIPPAGG